VLLHELNALAAAGHAALAEAHFRRLLGVAQGDAWPASRQRMLWNTMLKAFANAGQHVEAASHYEAMMRNRLAPNAKTFGKLLEAAAKAGDETAAEHWLREMTESRFSARALNYNELMHAAANAHHLEAAELWLHRMLEGQLQHAGGRGC
ncbi:unnamed protein product, partial [Polarella glacialis]